MASVDLGPIVVSQTKKYDAGKCGVGEAWDKCPKGTFDGGFNDCDWPLDNKRYCSKPDPALCDKVSEWKDYSSVEYKSGSTLGNAKVSCKWKNIPKTKLTQALIEEYLDDYGSEAKEAETGYNDLMAGYCMQSTSDCMDELGKSKPGVCTNVHSSDDGTRKFCGRWWDSIKGTKIGDQYALDACPSGTDRLDCKCVNASRPDNAEFHDLAKKIPFPATCWYNPCRSTSSGSQFIGSEHSGVSCDGQVCISNLNIDVDIAKGAVVAGDLNFDQGVECNLSSEKTVQQPAKSAANAAPVASTDKVEEAAPLEENMDMIGGLIVVVIVIAVIVLAAGGD